MSDSCFVDTNILVYAHDAGAGEKHEVARSLVRQLWLDRTGRLSTQVLQELYVNVRRKAKMPISPVEARELLSDYLLWQVEVNDGAAILAAAELEDRYQVSFWDALILQAARASGCRVLYSEDLSAGQVYAGVRVVNPFLEAP